jgi:hypothetical protein
VRDTLSFGKGLVEGVSYSFRTDEPLNVGSREEAFGILLGFGFKLIVKDTISSGYEGFKRKSMQKKDEAVNYIDKVRKDEKNIEKMESAKKNVKDLTNIAKTKIGGMLAFANNKIKSNIDKLDKGSDNITPEKDIEEKFSDA